MRRYHLQVQEGGLRRHHAGQHLDLGLAASGTVRHKSLSCKPPSLQCFVTIALAAWFKSVFEDLLSLLVECTPWSFSYLILGEVNWNGKTFSRDPVRDLFSKEAQDLLTRLSLADGTAWKQPPLSSGLPGSSSLEFCSLEGWWVCHLCPLLWWSDFRASPAT